MNKLKHGFTLGEVLITLGIIGTIAAITMPSIVKFSSTKTIGPMVGRCVQAIEQGISEVFSSSNGEKSISALQLKDVIPGSADATYLTNGNTLFVSTAGIMGSRQVSAADRTNYVAKVKVYSGNSNISTLYDNFAQNLVFKFGKSDGYVIPESMNDETVTSYLTTNGLDDIPGDVVIDRIFIDGNGKSGVNRLGIDVFLFGLTNSGKLVPAGSQAYNNNIFNENIPLYTAACNGTNVTDARACAARMVNDGWKIEYK